MRRILLIDADRTFGQTVAMACVERGIAIRLAETLCEGVRFMLHGPVSMVVIDAALLRLSGADQARLFDSVAPGVPVVVMAPGSMAVEETVALELRGFWVVTKPLDLDDLLAKMDVPVRTRASRPDTLSSDDICGVARP
jgi:DNA-binding response OmpR family regulator